MLRGRCYLPFDHVAGSGQKANAGLLGYQQGVSKDAVKYCIDTLPSQNRLAHSLT